MPRPQFPLRLTFVLAVVAAALALASDQGIRAQTQATAPSEAAAQAAAQSPASVGSSRLENYLRMHQVTPAMRRAAAEQRAAATAQGMKRMLAPLAPTLNPGGTPDYFNVGNYANSPLPLIVGGAVVPGTGIRKFIDSLPGLGSGNANTLGQYIPIAVKDTVTYGGSDFYRIAVGDYTEKMHTDLPPTKLRGYRDLAGAGADALNHYLGPLIIAQRGRPVRVEFQNLLSTGATGNLFIPVDTTAMGAGPGRLTAAGAPCNPDAQTTCASYTENRATLHLHGGHTPWISDGTPHQWITPAGESTVFKKGDAFQNVPDMRPTPASCRA